MPITTSLGGFYKSELEFQQDLFAPITQKSDQEVRDAVNPPVLGPQGIGEEPPTLDELDLGLKDEKVDGIAEGDVSMEAKDKFHNDADSTKIPTIDPNKLMQDNQNKSAKVEEIGSEESDYKMLNEIYQRLTQPKFGVPEGQKDILGEKKQLKDWDDSVPLKSFVPNSRQSPMQEIDPKAFQKYFPMLRELERRNGVKT